MVQGTPHGSYLERKRIAISEHVLKAPAKQIVILLSCLSWIEFATGTCLGYGGTMATDFHIAVDSMDMTNDGRF